MDEDAACFCSRCISLGGFMKELIEKSYWCRTSANTEYSLFRRKFSVSEKNVMKLAVSADSRYNLYLDGVFLGRGPRRGDLEHYSFEIYEETLSPGNHILAVEVISYHDGLQCAWGEIHYSNAFFAAGQCGDVLLGTPESWKCTADHSRRQLKWHEAGNVGVTPIAQMEKLDFDGSFSGWKDLEYDDSSWQIPECLCAGVLRNNSCDPASRWKLVADELPQMRAEFIDTLSILKSSSPALQVCSGTLSGKVDAGSHTLLLDLGKYYTHLPHLRIAGEGESRIRMAYAERLLDRNGKKSRKPIADGMIGSCGYGDQIHLPTTGGMCEFQPFWFRSGRYVELEIETNAPLEIHSLCFDFISFPLKKREIVPFSDPAIQKIFDISWHTARCCAHEHYEDCPYWEQMQYVGDTRIQALISYIGAGEGRLGRQAIRQFDQSRIASGLTMSRYPTNFRQIIPGFSLYWIMMIDDYNRFFGDADVIREHWKGIRDVLDYFEDRRESSGLIGCVGEWNFSDWVPEWPQGKSCRNTNLPETLLNMIYAGTCRIAAGLAEKINRDPAEYLLRYEKSKSAVNMLCYDRERKLYTDVPGEKWFSQHTNCWAILSGIAPVEYHNELIDRILNDENLSQCTLYFSFYLLELMQKTHNSGGFLKILKKWETVLDEGFTTFPECPSPDSRSDCHAWSSGPFCFLANPETRQLLFPGGASRFSTFSAE